VPVPAYGPAADDLWTRPEIIAPATLRAAISPRLLAGADVPTRAVEDQAAPDHPRDVLPVTGLAHVIALSRAIEKRGLANDLAVVETVACDEGCFGSPLLAIDRSWRDMLGNGPCDQQLALKPSA